MTEIREALIAARENQDGRRRALFAAIDAKWDALFAAIDAGDYEGAVALERELLGACEHTASLIDETETNTNEGETR